MINRNSLKDNNIYKQIVTKAQRDGDKYPLKVRQITNVNNWKCDKYPINMGLRDEFQTRA